MAQLATYGVYDLGDPIFTQDISSAVCNGKSKQYYLWHTWIMEYRFRKFLWGEISLKFFLTFHKVFYSQGIPRSVQKFFRFFQKFLLHKTLSVTITTNTIVQQTVTPSTAVGSTASSSTSIVTTSSKPSYSCGNGSWTLVENRCLSFGIYN